MGSRTIDHSTQKPATFQRRDGSQLVVARPPDATLAGHVAETFAQPNGRAYLVRVVLYGLEGPITVKGHAFAGAMPPWAQLKDDEIAAALDHVLTAWGNDKLLPRDFAAPIDYRWPEYITTARGMDWWIPVAADLEAGSKSVGTAEA